MHAVAALLMRYACRLPLDFFKKIKGNALVPDT
jgi:hypothetical protein